MPLDSNDDAPQSYTVRLTEPAEAEIEAAYLGLMRAVSFDFADRWQNGLFEAIRNLTVFPRSYEIAPESSQFQVTTRRLLYRQGKLIYRILFHLTDEDGDGREETVRILHVRHGAIPYLNEADEA